MRLTNSLKKVIIEKAVAEKFHDKLIASEKALIDSIEVEVVKMIKKRNIHIPQQLIDEGFINTSTNVELSKLPNSRMTYKYGNQADYSIYNSYTTTMYGSNLTIKETSKIITAHRTDAKLLEQRTKFKKDLTQTLNAFTTVKKLVEAMPEIKQFIDDSNIPMSNSLIPIEQINKMRRQLK